MIEPLKDYILLERESEDIKTESGIFVAAQDDKQQYHGVYARVLAIGPLVASRAIKPGRRIIVNRYDTLPIRDGARTVEMLKEELVYGVCRD